MKVSTLFSLVASLALAGASGVAHAAPELRGFQVDINGVDAPTIAELANTWGINVVRVQVGDDFNMDGVTGNDYVAMMEGRMAVLDQKLPLFAAHNIKVVFALYSPPGGFERRDAPSHYLMFSRPELQPEFISMWQRIAQRYKDNPTILAFDLLNEPAMRGSLVASGAKTWNQLLPEAIEAVRAIAPNSRIMVKSLYGDPTNLAKLPALHYENLIYSYHAYPYLRYQHSGIDTAPFAVKRPAPAQVQKKMKSLLGRFYLKQMNYFNKRKIGSFPPIVNVGEAAVSACAQEGAAYLDSILAVLERDGKPERAALKFAQKHSKAGRRKRIRRGLRPLPAPNAKQLQRFIRHHSYTIHAFGEAEVWDPRTECSAQGAFARAGAHTDRSIVLQSYFSRNP